MAPPASHRGGRATATLGAALAAWFALGTAAHAQGKERIYFDGRTVTNAVFSAKPWDRGDGYIEGVGSNMMFSERIVAGDFALKLRLSLHKINSTGAGVAIGDSVIVFDGNNRQIALGGRWAGFGEAALGDAAKRIEPGKPFDAEIRRTAGKLTIRIQGKDVGGERNVGDGILGRIHLVPNVNKIRLYRASVDGAWRSPGPPTPEEQNAVENRVNGAVTRGVRWLMDRQQFDGSWGYRANSWIGGITALAAYTMIKSGVPQEHPSLVRAFAFLDGIEPTEVYSAAVMCLLYDAAKRPDSDAHIRRCAAKLMQWNVEGDYSYPRQFVSEERGFNKNPGPHDLSNLQFAVLGLTAAKRHGVDVPSALWSSILKSARMYQERDALVDAPAESGKTGVQKAAVAGFGYTTPTPSYGSMTIAGVTAIKLCLDAAEKQLSPDEVRGAQQSMERGMRWLERSFEVEKNPNKGDHHFYYLYGIERLGAFFKTDVIGGHSWYQEGAEWLLQIQDPAGYFGGWTHEEPDTCFALLFLRKATALQTGKASSTTWGAWTCDDPESPVAFHARGFEKLDFWITELRRERFAAAGAEWPPKIAAVEYCDGKNVLAHVEGDASKTWKDERFAAAYAQKGPGKMNICARVILAGGKVMESKRVELVLEAMNEPWMFEYATQRSRNLMLDAVYTSAASSDVPGWHFPIFAFDGVSGTRWYCAREDQHPAAVAEFSNPIKANRIVLYPSTVSKIQLGLYDRIIKIDLRVNGDKKPMIVAAPDDERLPIVVNLPKAIPITSIDARIVERAPGTQWKGHCGFADIALELQK